MSDHLAVAMKNVGLSWMIDFSGVDDSQFHTHSVLIQLLQEAAQCGGLTEIDHSTHQFPSQDDQHPMGGSTAFLLLAESHLSVHTWSEYQRVVVDLFSCGSADASNLVITYLTDHIPHTDVQIKQYNRGDTL